MSDSSVPIIMSGITRSFGDLVAVDDLTLEVQKGTILGMIGPSGSGKTTVIRMLTGSLEPSSGEIRVLGEIPRKFSRHARERIGYMPQLFMLWEELTAKENVAFVAALFGLLWRRRRRRVREVLQSVELWDARHRRAKQLSGGMQKRLALAAAMVHEPELLFVDEPSSGLDPNLRQKIWHQFRVLRDQGRTLVVTTQYLGEAENCDQVALISDGRLVALDTPEKLRHRVTGGDVIDIETASAFDAGFISDIDGVIRIRQPELRKLLVYSKEAATTTPRVLQALQSRGIEVVASTEYRPTFDEVFSELLAQDRQGQKSRNGRVTANAA